MPYEASVYQRRLVWIIPSVALVSISPILTNLCHFCSDDHYHHDLIMMGVPTHNYLFELV